MKIALVGLGRTGKIVAKYLLEQNALSMVLCGPNSVNANKDIGEILNIRDTGIRVETSDHLEQKLLQNRPDVLIDFSYPGFLMDYIHVFEAIGINIITAVTTYEAVELEKIKNTARMGNIGIVVAPNITYGVNVLMHLAEIAAELMDGYDIEIYEEHHKQKKDSPSGTAKKLAEKLQQNLITHEEIPIHAVRAGESLSKHKVLLCGEFDRIEISHQSYSKNAFAKGAYQAAKFIAEKTGFYEMDDVFKQEKEKRRNTLVMRLADENRRTLSLA
ncbi:4-hydroxy-tetrahydrodipicolinate reductase [Sporomusaceae bacterium BoRhaA]|uniref:4-hydroxy-tetrahydrodipicolinate reductase n=1 Tax=Pelorhabdus rhamnosifermentans TaxID=2772457 RepID=UPI001C0647D5|nr:4-hydroxy-tetrahydrodipicolinate reductase [Pelorhabdus rhamnosifermentans]MBU2700158.1 4-hydroxy-tetrahydrodipicolinate reductase [Pelorhabdus rhamnosifermentans]